MSGPGALAGGWAELVSAALLGTERQTGAPVGLPGPVAALAGRVADPSAEGRLLATAALTISYRRAGRRQEPAVPVPAEAPPETAEPVGPAAAVRLDQLLVRNDADLLDEWLLAAAGTGRRVPAEALPALLGAALRHRQLADRLAPVLGRRGEWLAAFRPDWRRLVGASLPAGPTDPDAWAYGDPATRLAYLINLRRRDPAAARELIAESWRTEAAAERAGFLGVLTDGLGDADEALLEPALDDRSRQVRWAAAQLLCLLPASAFGARMAARVQAWVQPQRHRLRPRIAVAPPAECDPAMIRDGVPPTPDTHGVGPRAWWLEQVVARTPLGCWPAVLGAEPAAAVGLPVEGDWGPVLRAGWVTAAIQQRDAAWAAALLPGEPLTGRSEPFRLLDVLPAADRAATVVRMLARNPVLGVPPAKVGTAQSLLASCERPWPAPLVDELLGQLARPTDEQSRGAAMAWVLPLAARSLPPSAAGRVAELAARQPEGSSWRAALGEVADLLTFRHEMHEELR